MKKELKKYYEDKRIYPLNFNCKHLNKCIAKARNKSEFTTGHGAYIGAKYEKGDIPRLLFLSLDSGSAELDQRKRTTETLSKGDNNWLPGNMDKPKHWYRTHQFAWYVFNEINKSTSSKLDIGKVDHNYDFKPMTQIHKIKPYFAHTNSAKCCMNNEKRKQANPTLFKNCKEYVLEEIEILKPDILVTQGDPARAVAEEIKKRAQIIKKENISKANKNKDDFHILKISNGRMLLWIHHYHPTNFGAFKKNRDKYKTYAEKTVEFIKNFPKGKNKIFPHETKKKAKLKSDQITKTYKKKDKKTYEVKENDKSIPRWPGNSLIADFFYNETNYREGKPPEKIVSEMDKLWQKGECITTTDTITFNVNVVYPELKNELKSVEGKVKKMIGWALSKKLITKDGETIGILPIKK